MDCIHIELLSKVLYNVAWHSPIHAHIHTLSEVRVRCVAQGHLDTRRSRGSSYQP